MSKKILFVSHEATRTGAPILLLNLSRALIKNGFEVHFLLHYEGPLEKEFRLSGPTWTVHKFPNSFVDDKIKRIRNNLFRTRMKGRMEQYDMVLSNTITNGSLDDIIGGHKNIMTYVHELAFTIGSCVKKPMLDKVIKHTKTFLAPSLAVRNSLRDDYGIKAGMIKQLPYLIPDEFQNKKEYRQAMREKLGLGDNTFVVGSMGVQSWRKGVDIFLQVAKKTANENAAVKFVWCGGSPSTQEWMGMEWDIKNLGLNDSVLMLPSTPQSKEIMSCFDVFFLSSREDPYPLVVIEAAMMEIPAIVYDKSGGATEFVSNECGLLVDYINVPDTASSIIRLKEDNVLRSRLAANARKKYLALHTEENVYPLFLELLGKE